LINRIVADDATAAERILFPGFLSEATKTALLTMAQFVVYPSFFEGYGIPVAEAAVLGKFVVCSNTSSLPEVYPQRSFLFDPADLHSFATAMSSAELASKITFLNRLDFSEIWADRQRHSWDATYAVISSWVSEV